MDGFKVFLVLIASFALFTIAPLIFLGVIMVFWVIIETSAKPDKPFLPRVGSAFGKTLLTFFIFVVVIEVFSSGGNNYTPCSVVTPQGC